MDVLGYEDVRTYLIQHLLHDAKLHEEGDYEKIGDGYEDIEVGVYSGKGPEFVKLAIALTFWDCWQDARNHNWKYYKGIDHSDWPILARKITDTLVEDTDITDPLIIKHFGPRKNSNLLQSMFSLFKK